MKFSLFFKCTLIYCPESSNEILLYIKMSTWISGRMLSWKARKWNIVCNALMKYLPLCFCRMSSKPLNILNAAHEISSWMSPFLFFCAVKCRAVCHSGIPRWLSKCPDNRKKSLKFRLTFPKFCCNFISFSLYTFF